MCFYHLLFRTHQYFCDLNPLNFKLHNDLKIQSKKKRMVTETASTRHNKEKRSFNSAIPCGLKDLGVCTEGSWIKDDFLYECRW